MINVRNFCLYEPRTGQFIPWCAQFRHRAKCVPGWPIMSGFCVVCFGKPTAKQRWVSIFQLNTENSRPIKSVDNSSFTHSQLAGISTGCRRCPFTNHVMTSLGESARSHHAARHLRTVSRGSRAAGRGGGCSWRILGESRPVGVLSLVSGRVAAAPHPFAGLRPCDTSRLPARAPEPQNHWHCKCCQTHTYSPAKALHWSVFTELRDFHPEAMQGHLGWGAGSLILHRSFQFTR